MQIDAEQMADAIAKSLRDNHFKELLCPLDAERRLADHEWVLLHRKKEEERIKFWRDMNFTLTKYGLIGVIIFLVGVFAVGVRQRMILWLSTGG